MRDKLTFERVVRSVVWDAENEVMYLCCDFGGQGNDYVLVFRFLSGYTPSAKLGLYLSKPRVGVGRLEGR